MNGAKDVGGVKKAEKRSYIGGIFYKTLSELIESNGDGTAQGAVNAGIGELPADPFKVMQRSLQYQEFSHDSRLFNSPPSDQQQSSFRANSKSYLDVVALGDSGAYSLSHLSGLVSLTALERVIKTTEALRLALGSLQSTVKTRGIECSFIDVPTVSSCLSEELSQPFYYRLEMIVEGIVTNKSSSTFDECINLYARRILEEAFHAEQSPDIVSSEITVLMGRRLDQKQKIDVRHISSRRQQVLSTLKAATVGDGEIMMEILIKMRRSLAFFDIEGFENSYNGTNGGGDPSDADKRDLGYTSGFMKITRHYHFSYRDDKGFNRCFARHPFDSLCRGVFLNDNDVVLYKNLYLSHISKVSRTTGNADDEEEPAGPDDPIFLNQVFRLVEQTKKFTVQGEFVFAAEWLILLCTIIKNDEQTLVKASRLMSADIGRVHSVRNALTVISAVSSTIETRVLEVLNGMGKGGVTDTDNSGGRGKGSTGKDVSVELLTMIQHFSAISLAYEELKTIILAMCSEIKYSEFQTIKAGLVHELWQMFDKEKRLVPLVNPKDVTRDRRGLIAMVGMIRDAKTHVTKISTYLRVLEATLGSNIMMHLMRTAPKQDKLQARQLHKWTETPSSMCDLLGFVECFDKMEIIRSPRTRATQSWFLNLERSNTKMAFGLRDPVRWDDVISFLDFSNLEQNFLWASTTVPRPKNHFAELDFNCMIVDELERHEAPKFMVEEAAIVRYLVETHCLRALSETAFSSFTARVDSPLSINAKMSLSLNRYNNYLGIANNMDREAIIRRLYTPARIKDAMHAVPGMHGACKIKVINKYINGPKSKYTSGGVFGSNRLLSVLGYNAQNIFTHVWMIPPLFATRPNSMPGLTMSINVGISGQSALHWGMPKKHFHDEPDPAPGVAKPKDKDKSKDKGDGFHSRLAAYTLYHLPEPLEIEVVIKYSYDIPAAEARARKSFGYELSRCSNHLSTAPEWKLNKVTIPHVQAAKKDRRRGGSDHDDYDSDDDDKGTNSSEYTSGELNDRGADLNMQVMAAKHCYASIECVALFPDHATGRESELLEMVSKIVSTPRKVTDENPNYDRTVDEMERVFGEDTAASAIQRYLREQKVPRPYVPCKINFTLLAKERVALRKGGGIAGVLGNRAPPTASTRETSDADSQSNTRSREDKGSVPPKGQPIGSPGLTIGQHAINRLVARTLWFSQEACNNIWSCTNGQYKLCYGELAEDELEAYKQCKISGLHLDSLHHLRINAMLTCQYDIFLDCSVRSTTVASSLHTVCAYIKSTRDLLAHNYPSTLNLVALQRTLLIYISLGLRMVMLAPDCVHLRGGCFLIMNRLKYLEGLLALMPESLILPDKSEFVNINYYESSLAMVQTGSDGPASRGGRVEEEQRLRVKEFDLRKALGGADTVEEAVKTLGEIGDMASILLEALSKDIDADLMTLDMRMKFRGMNDNLHKMKPTLDLHRTRLTNKGNPNAILGAGQGQQQLPPSLSVMFSHEGLTSIEQEELFDARRDWIHREAHDEKLVNPPEVSRKQRPLLDVAMAAAKFNSKSTKLSGMSESQKDRFDDKRGGAHGPLQKPDDSSTVEEGDGPVPMLAISNVLKAANNAVRSKNHLEQSHTSVNASVNENAKVSDDATSKTGPTAGSSAVSASALKNP